MHAAVLLSVILLGGVTSCTCTKADESRTELPGWLPLAGLPVPGHPMRRSMSDWQARPLTLSELIQVAYTFHPRMDHRDYATEQAFDEDFASSREQHLLYVAQQTGYQRLPQWHALCEAVRQALPPGFVVTDRTYPRYYPTYMLVIDAPREPGSDVDRQLVVHLSYLVPYYAYYERHIRLIERFRIDRGPMLHEVTPVHRPVLEIVEREISRRYGYWHMDPEMASTTVPGIYIMGLNLDRTPTLMDALFTPHRW